MLRKGPYIVGIGESFQVQHLLFYFGRETRGEISRAFLMNGEKYISSKSNWTGTGTDTIFLKGKSVVLRDAAITLQKFSALQ